MDLSQGTYFYRSYAFGLSRLWVRLDGWIRILSPKTFSFARWAQAQARNISEHLSRVHPRIEARPIKRRAFEDRICFKDLVGRGGFEPATFAGSDAQTSE